MRETMIIDGEIYDSETGELINEVEQVEVEVIENTLPDIVCNGGTHIKTNTNQLKRELSLYLEKYNVEVTEENEKDCSKMATELNQIAKTLDEKRKATASLIKKPADDLKIAVDELIKIVQDKRASILEGVNQFKSKRMELVRSLLKSEIEKLYIENKVEEKYQVCNIESLVLEGSLSKTQLTKKAIESLESMVRKVKNIQDSVTIREMQLELKCSNAGLITPIELSEVEHIIELDNYDMLLDEMIQKRISIQEQVKRQIELQEVQKQEMLKQEDIRKQKEQEQKQLLELQKQQEVQKITGKKIVKLIATFEIEVSSDIPDLQVLKKFETALKGQYPTTLKMVAPF